MSISRSIVCLLFLSFCGVCVCGQDKSPLPPLTKLEEFQGRTGSVIIKAYSEVGTISSPSGSLEVDSMELRDARPSGVKVLGITIQVKEAGHLERQHTSFIDFDEIDSLIKGLDYVATIDKSVTQLNNFEASYRTKGELEIVTFNSNGGMRAAVSSGSIGRARAFISLTDLDRLRTLVIEAKGKLEGTR